MKSPDVLDEAEIDEVAQPGAPTFNPIRLVVLAGGLVALGWWQGWRLLAVILSIVVMIFLHELGHFVMARRAGMKVTEFFIGFGPRVWSFRRGEVEYGIKAIPAGAYVRIIGMTSADEVAPEDEARTYREKGFLARLGVAVAGSSMHFLLAILLAFVAFAGFGMRDATTWAVSEATPGSSAALAGIQVGDRVVAVDGTRVSTFDEMSEEVRRHPGEDVDLQVLRDGSEITISTQLGEKAAIIGTVGEDLSLGGYDDQVRINSVGTDSRAHAAGLRDGDLVRSMNGVQLTSLDQLDLVVTASTGGKVAIDYVRSETPRTTSIDLGRAIGSTTPKGFFGVGQERIAEQVGVVDAAGRSVSTLWRGITMSISGIGQVFSPANLADFANRTFNPPDTNDARPTPAAESGVSDAASDNLNRPVSIIGIVGLGNQLTNIGSFLAFLAAINITIGVINLIPLLPFDGGHVMVAVYERIRELLRRDGRRYFVDANKLIAPIYAVVIIMVFVGLLAGYSDIVRPIQL